MGILLGRPFIRPTMGTDDEAHRSITSNTDADFGGGIHEQRILDGQRAFPDGVFFGGQLH